MSVTRAWRAVNCQSNGGTPRVAFLFERPDPSLQGRYVSDWAGEAAALEDADLDLGHVQPAPMFGCVVKLQSLQNRPRPLRREGLIERGCNMGVEVVAHQPDVFRVRITLFDEKADAFSAMVSGAALGDRHMPPAGRQLDHHEQVGNALADILVVPALDGSRLRWQERARLGVQDHGFLIHADSRVGRVVGLFVEIQNVFHRSHEVGSYVRDTPSPPHQAAKWVRTSLTVLWKTSRAWQIPASLQPSPSFNKTWLRVRALLWPRCAYSYNRSRLLADNGTGDDIEGGRVAGMRRSFRAHYPTSLVNFSLDCVLDGRIWAVR